MNARRFRASVSSGSKVNTSWVRFCASSTISWLRLKAINSDSFNCAALCLGFNSVAFRKYEAAALTSFDARYAKPS